MYEVVEDFKLTASISSVLNTLHRANRPWSVSLMRLNNRLLLMPNRWWDYMLVKLNQGLYNHDFAANGKRAYLEHYAHVKEIVPAENLLEYHIKEGWEPLCKFLDKPVPDEKVPRLNSREEFMQDVVIMHKNAFSSQLRRIINIAAYTSLAVTVVSVASVIMGKLPRRWLR